MDSYYGLKVFRNNAREFANKIESIAAKLYSLDYLPSKTVQQSSTDIEVTDYHYIKISQEGLDI
ncbi:hypothetical protein ACNVED_16835 (plasmid) [Legionella sp. D16C41]|uniref:hypothetical protein n=1 Tax=Legionella sp. D16C41 TaxID=3402688 RepID=UPI003AF49FB9